LIPLIILKFKKLLHGVPQRIVVVLLAITYLIKPAKAYAAV